MQRPPQGSSTPAAIDGTLATPREVGALVGPVDSIGGSVPVGDRDPLEADVPFGNRGTLEIELEVVEGVPVGDRDPLEADVSAGNRGSLEEEVEVEVEVEVEDVSAGNRVPSVEDVDPFVSASLRTLPRILNVENDCRVMIPVVINTEARIVRWRRMKDTTSIIT